MNVTGFVGVTGFAGVSGVIGPPPYRGPTGDIDRNIDRENREMSGDRGVPGDSDKNRKRLFKFEDLKITIELWDNQNGGFNEKLFIVSKTDDEWKVIDCIVNNKILISSEEIEVCIEYLFLIFKYSESISAGPDDWCGVLIQLIPNSEPFTICEFEKKNLDEKDFIQKLMMFIKETFPEDD